MLMLERPDELATSTSTRNCLPSTEKILSDKVTARVDSKQILGKIWKYDCTMIRVNQPIMLKEVPMSLKLCIINWNVLHTFHPGCHRYCEISVDKSSEILIKLANDTVKQLIYTGLTIK